MVGRGLRTSPGKKDCHIIDMTASLAKGIVTTPTLFGLDPNEVVKDATAEDLQTLQSRKEKQRELAAAETTETGDLSAAIDFSGNVTFTHFDDVHSLIENTSGERHIRGLSRLAWVQVDSTRYVLSDKSGSYLTLQLQPPDFVVTLTQKLRAPPSENTKSPFMRPIIIASTSTFEHAVNAADTFAKKRFTAPMVLSTAPWRRMPATPQQVDFLNRFREEGKKLHTGSVSKGVAADWITKLKFGARGRFKRLQSKKAKDEKQRSREQKGIVRVGPVN